MFEESFGDCFRKSFLTHQNNNAITFIRDGKVETEISYIELDRHTNRMAHGFQTLGIKKGDRVILFIQKSLFLVVSHLALQKIGAVSVPLNPGFKKSEMKYLIQDVKAKVILSEPAKEALIREIDPNLTNLVVDSQKLYHDIDVFSGVSEKFIPNKIKSDDPGLIIYTSGTTGNPKGATLTHHNILNNGFFVGESQVLTEKDRLVIPVPLYHCFGMVMGNLGCITHGSTMIYPSEGFEPKAVLQAVHQEKATALYGVPTMFIAQLAEPEFESYDLSTLRTGIMAGSICPAEVMRKVNGKMNMKEVQIAYGMTETSPVSTQTSSLDPFEKQVTTVGRTQPHLEIKIVDPATGNVLPRGEIGELCTRGYSVMLKYWNNEEKTREAIDDAGWMHTEDLATMDEEGYIQIVGRIKDMVIRGGENIYPKEVEEFLYTHPSIEEVQVTGIPHDKYGEELVAWVKLRPDSDPVNADDLMAFCKGKIAHFKIPRNYKFVDAFPMTVTGKIQKFKMREISIEDMGQK
ncbi:hypothetical protein LCGC14_2374060 [marine sediment metagenome]|uniref:AMP-dependent synthetase/ligase domain-containing protein n=1 Tax=marine sediment metagenome TaxID=412755 RepID=A0A0F9EFA3_9ZZZZ